MSEQIILEVENRAKIEARAKQLGFQSLQEYFDFLIARDKLRYEQEQQKNVADPNNIKAQRANEDTERDS